MAANYSQQIIIKCKPAFLSPFTSLKEQMLVISQIILDD
jgi:hypothetical protein